MSDKQLSAFFQMDPLEKLNESSDSTISIIKEGLKNNIKIWVGSPKQVTLKKSAVTTVGNEVLNENLTIGKKDELEIKKFDFFLFAKIHLSISHI